MSVTSVLFSALRVKRISTVPFPQSYHVLSCLPLTSLLPLTSVEDPQNDASRRLFDLPSTSPFPTKSSFLVQTLDLLAGPSLPSVPHSQSGRIRGDPGQTPPPPRAASPDARLECTQSSHGHRRNWNGF